MVNATKLETRWWVPLAEVQMVGAPKLEPRWYCAPKLEKWCVL